MKWGEKVDNKITVREAFEILYKRVKFLQLIVAIMTVSDLVCVIINLIKN